MAGYSINGSSQAFPLTPPRPFASLPQAFGQTEGDFWDLVNSGQHATYFAGRSFDPEVNLPKVKLLPEIFYFPAGGAAVHHIAAPGEVTLARLTRKNGRYWMAIAPAEFLAFPEEEALVKAQATTGEWPHAFTRLRGPPERCIA